MRHTNACLMDTSTSKREIRVQSPTCTSCVFHNLIIICPTYCGGYTTNNSRSQSGLTGQRLLIKSSIAIKNYHMQFRPHLVAVMISHRRPIFRYYEEHNESILNTDVSDLANKKSNVIQQTMWSDCSFFHAESPTFTEMI